MKKNKSFVIQIPCPPSVNASLTIARGGKRMIKTAVSRKWQEEAIFLMQCKAREISWEKLNDPGIEVIIHVNINRRRDIGNIEKSTTDVAEQSGIILNDNRVDAIHVYRADNINGREIPKDWLEMQIK